MKLNNKILVTGGSGRFGKTLKNLITKILLPNKKTIRHN